MSKVGRLWEWLLPELICLSPMGAIAYYNACVAKEASRQESPREERRAVDSGALRGSVVAPLARL